MRQLREKASLYAWGALQVLKLGRPNVTLGFLGGIGDDLLCTAAIHEWLTRGAQRVWFVTRHPMLYRPTDPRIRLLPEDPRLLKLAIRLGQPMRAVSYSTYDDATDRDSALTEHCIATMCRNAGITGRVNLRPYLNLTAQELAAVGNRRDALVFQSSSINAIVPMRTKQWPVERMQQVVNRVAKEHVCIQIGSRSDPPLHNVVDLRGQTSLRESAAILAQARLFVGLVGFLMHLARAVDCRAVVVYGGREVPEYTGYSCNINVTHRPPCSPCWQRNRCDFAHICMNDLPASAVIEGVDRALALPREALVADEATL